MPIFALLGYSYCWMWQGQVPDMCLALRVAFLVLVTRRTQKEAIIVFGTVSPKKTDLQIVGVGGPFLLPRVSASVPPPTPASVDNIDFQHLSKLARFVLTFDIFTQ